MVSFYEDVIDDALESHSVFRVIAGTSWIEDISVEAFMEYEGQVNALFEARDAMGLCHYGRTRVVVVADGFHPGGRPTTWVGGGLIVIAVTVYRYDRTPSCGRSGNDLQ